MRTIYTFFIRLYALVVSIVALWHPKAKLWKNGRKHWETTLQQKIPEERKIVWFHCASLGEFDQGLPVMEQLKNNEPELFFVVSFFSPSGYEHRKKHPIIDLICYIPIDTQKNANRFIQIVRPAYAVFVKYEFWYNFLNTLYCNQIPTVFISSNFRPSQPFFKWYGGWFRKQLKQITAFFVQNETSKKLLTDIGIQSVFVSGDTRFDRVAKLAQQTHSLPLIEKFKNNHFLLVAGSSWQPEEKILEKMMKKQWKHLKLIIAPHDVSEPHILQIEKQFPNQTIRYTEATPENIVDKNILLINNIGILNKIYRYADTAFIGGAFGKGLHNILEAACYGVPIIFGPKFQKFPEATMIMQAAGGFHINSTASFIHIFEKLFNDNEFLIQTKRNSAHFVQSHQGATDIIIKYLINL